MLLCLILGSLDSVCPLRVLEISGKAFARDSRFEINFLEGRLRFLEDGFCFSILEIKAECLIVRLSLLEEPKALLIFWSVFLEAFDFIPNLWFGL